MTASPWRGRNLQSFVSRVRVPWLSFRGCGEMGFQRSQINIVLSALDYLGVSVEDAGKMSYNELDGLLSGYDIPDAVWVELWAEGSGKKPRVRNIVHTKPIARVRFIAMLKQLHQMEYETT